MTAGHLASGFGILGLVGPSQTISDSMNMYVYTNAFGSKQNGVRSRARGSIRKNLLAPGALEGEVSHLRTHTTEIKESLVGRRDVVIKVTVQGLCCTFDES